MNTETTDHVNSMTFHIHRQIEIAAPPAIAFAAVLEQIGPANGHPDGPAMPMKLEAWPGGRWFRDLGNNAGHLWGHVQVIKPPTLLELTGPMFMSYAAINFVQYRLTEQAGGRATLLSFTHRALGDISREHREGVSMGWGHMLDSIKARAQR